MNVDSWPNSLCFSRATNGIHSITPLDSPLILSFWPLIEKHRKEKWPEKECEYESKGHDRVAFSLFRPIHSLRPQGPELRETLGGRSFLAKFT